MSLKSGWCMDEVQYRNLDNESYAAHLHTQCKSTNCPCPNHKEFPDDDD